MPDFAREFGANAAYVEDLHARYLTDPASVSPDWREYFERIAPRGSNGDGLGPAPESARETPRPKAPPSAGTARTLIRGIAGKILENMEASLGVPTASSVRSISVKLLEENRRILNKRLPPARVHKASYTHLVAFAMLHALREQPRLNAAFERDTTGAWRVERGQINLGIAIDIENEDGTRALLVPNIKDAGRLDFHDFVHAYNEVVQAARAGKLTPRDFQDTTVTLTNPGTLGTVASMPRLMAGQGLILATGAIDFPPEYRSMAPEVLAHLGVSKVMTLTSTYDHRIVQGAESGLFLRRIDELLQAEDGFYEQAFAAVGCAHRPIHRAVDINPSPFGGGAAASEAIEKQARVLQLINAYRVRGVLIADINPLAYEPETHPELEMETYGLTVWDLDRHFITGGLAGKPMATLREILGILSDTYCRYMGVEYMHIAEPEQKRWLQQRMEPVRNEEPFTPEAQRHILDKLNAAEAFEKFLHSRFVGHKRFSLEGAETLIPMLDELLDRVAAGGAREVVVGMSHRGRLNVLANTFNKSNRQIFSEFEGIVDPDSVHGSGDVKYHLGATGKHVDAQGREVRITMPSNPSHLEAVDPVVEGMARAKQDAISQIACLEQGGGDGNGAERADPVPQWKKTLAVLIHGDAAFAGQGVVAETLNMSQLRGYRTGGTVHIIVNNQIGYTAGPSETRSMRYASDLAKGVGAPILHVNGDYPETALRAVRIALDYRDRFHRDVVVDLICYRRWGHNETDEPSFTQPLLYRNIKNHPSVRECYGQRLVERGKMSEEERLASVNAYSERFKQALHSFRESPPEDVSARIASTEECEARDTCAGDAPETGVDLAALTRIVGVALDPPEAFHVHPKIVRQMEKRRAMLRGDLPIDWGCGEMMAFGSLLLEGIAVRLAGQDSARGTFSHRHAVIVDQEAGRDWVPIEKLAQQTRFSVVDSALSEEAALGFEYGYAVGAPEALVMWEAQFGDFVNGAQIQIDQFIAASEEKWNQTCGVVLLLPHGLEGQGSEHSSARLERFLILCAQGNMTVANCTTPAQYFHLLRRQAHSPLKRPLVIMTPKSLLKKPAAGSSAAAFTTGRFRFVLDDPEMEDPIAARKIVLCSGKIYYDLKEYSAEHGVADTVILRLEQLYPFPRRRLEELVGRHPAAHGRLVWVQEEPRNMGAWSYVSERLRAMGLEATYVGRPPSAAPAAGSLLRHRAEQRALLEWAYS